MTTIAFPMSYRVHGYLPGRQQPRTYVFAEMSPLEITRVDRRDAPLAVSWTEPRPTKIALHSRSPEEGVVNAWGAEAERHTVYHDGAHWFPLAKIRARGDESPVSGLSVEDADTALNNGSYNGLLGFARTTQGRKQYDFVAGDPVERFASYTEHGRKAAVRNFEALRMISVDGQVYIKCSQPAFRFEKPETMRYPFVDIWEGQHASRFGSARAGYLPLSKISEVDSIAANFPRHLADPSADVIVHLPETIDANADLVVTADFLVLDFMKMTERSTSTRWAMIERYFQCRTADEKLAYLSASAREWPHFEGKYGISVNSLRKAVEYLEAISIDLGSTFANIRL
jgi:hypothetical protein